MINKLYLNFKLYTCEPTDELNIDFTIIKTA